MYSQHLFGVNLQSNAIIEFQAGDFMLQRGNTIVSLIDRNRKWLNGSCALMMKLVVPLSRSLRACAGYWERRTE